MNVDPASMTPAHRTRTRVTRADRAAGALWGPSNATWVRLSLAGFALAFVVLGADGLDVGPMDARLGLAAGEPVGPLGQVFGNWAPDIWPAQVWPSQLLARLGSGGRPTSAAIRWPAALAAILGGWIVARGMNRSLGHRAAISMGLCWFGCLAVMDRSAAAGLDMIVGVAALATIERLLGRGADWVAGLWASLAFLAGGWPPLLLIALTIIVIGRRGSWFSLGLLLPPLATAVLWSIATIRITSDEQFWAAALTLPLTRGQDWSLAGWTLLLAMPWTPFSLMALSRSVRDAWPAQGRVWVKGWLQAALACAIAGSAVPGLGPAARVVALTGLLVAAAASLELAWSRAMTAIPRRAFFAAFSAVFALWLIVMIYGCFIWIMTMPYYRTLGIVVGLIVVAAAYLGWSSLGTSNTTRGLVTLLLFAVGLKLACWGYYAPEWNYRRSQRPWGRAIGQWVPRKWPVYTFHDWSPDLAFFLERTVRQYRSPRFLNYLSGPECRFVLLQTAEFDNWPDHAPPLTPIARFQDQSGEERVLACTQGLFPVPGQNVLVPSREAKADAPLSVK